MISLIKTELWKIKRYSVLYIGIAAMLSVVLLTRFMAIASDGTIQTLENFSSNVIWNNFTLLYPATITVIAGYLMERERTDDTLKNILAVPISFRRLLMGKLLTCGLIAVFLAFVLYVFTLSVFFISKYPGFEIISALRALFQMIGMNLFVYIAVLPIIIFTGSREGTFMAGTAFAFFYGFIGTFATGHGLANLYPISAGLSLIHYQGDGIAEELSQFVSFTVILVVLLISVIMIFFSDDRVKKKRKNL